MAHGELFILSAPSGTGKTTLIRSMMAELAGFGDVAFSVSHTTRRQRRGEVDGRDYHFVDGATFERMVAEERFLEWAEVHGQRYGTSSDEVLPRREQGVDVIVDLDVQGAQRMMELHPEAHTIFILPPSFADLEARLRGRGLDDPQEIARRLSVSRWEIKCYVRYQYVIINDDAERASDVLAAIILDKRHRRARMQDRIARVLEHFGVAPPENDTETASRHGRDPR